MVLYATKGINYQVKYLTPALFLYRQAWVDQYLVLIWVQENWQKVVRQIFTFLPRLLTDQMEAVPRLVQTRSWYLKWSCLISQIRLLHKIHREILIRQELKSNNSIEKIPNFEAHRKMGFFY